MESLVTRAVPTPGEDLRRAAAKQRLYVFTQLGGWGTFFAMQLTLTLLFSDDSKRRSGISVACLWLMIAAEGLLLTHFSRALMARWNWKRLDWRLLLPRLLALSLGLAIAWTAVGYAYTHGVLGEHEPSKYSLPILLLITVVNCWIIMVGWLCIYYFYHLFDRFNRSEVERARLATHVKEAELRALKSQVNPHFIFNSLNSLRALIDENPARARTAVTQLANLLRYSLQSSQLETVPFEDELRIVNDYLALEQVRHEERLRVRLDIAPETLQLPIPPLLLQTLVENAVKYGISARAEGGEISIVARQERGALLLQVMNPGSLPSAFPPAAPAGASTGLGLRNAGERLRLLFGDRATLHLRPAAQNRVVAEATIPLVSST